MSFAITAPMSDILTLFYSTIALFPFFISLFVSLFPPIPPSLFPFSFSLLHLQAVPVQPLMGGVTYNAVPLQNSMYQMNTALPPQAPPPLRAPSAPSADAGGYKATDTPYAPSVGYAAPPAYLPTAYESPALTEEAMPSAPPMAENTPLMKM